MAVEIDNYPDYTDGSIAVLGKLFLCYLNYGPEATATSPKWLLLGGSRNNPLTIESDSIDASSKSSSGYGEHLPGTASWSSDTEVVLRAGDQAFEVLEHWKLNQDVQTEKPALNFAFVNTQTKEYYTGWGTITSLELDTSYDDVVTATWTIEGTGPITKKTGWTDPGAGVGG